MSIELTKPELRSLTGKIRWTAQLRELEAMGIPYKRRTNGSLVVIRAHVEGHQEAQAGAGATLRVEPLVDLRDL